MIEIKQVNYSLNSKAILENIDLKITDAEFVAIIGPNGAGKSTLIKLMIGLLDCKLGSIHIDGEDHQSWLRTVV
jgi:zinc transport system ATP-binding protein